MGTVGALLETKQEIASRVEESRERNFVDGSDFPGLCAKFDRRLDEGNGRRDAEAAMADVVSESSEYFDSSGVEANFLFRFTQRRCNRIGVAVIRASAG
jgi:hypothetical protein